MDAKTLNDMQAAADKLGRRAAGYRMTGDKRLAVLLTGAAMAMDTTIRMVGDALAAEAEAREHALEA